MAILAQLRYRLVVPAIRAARIASFRQAPVRSRLELMRLPRLRRLSKARRVRLDVGHVRFESEVDVRAFDEVFFAGTYETDYRGALVLDVGAHKGYYAAFAVLRGAAQVESFEPAPVNAAILRETAAAFDGRCTVHEAAVGADDTEAILNLSAESWRHSLLPIDSNDAVRVHVVSFARILGRLRGDTRVIVKIDAEGAECEITLGTPIDAWAPVDEVFVEHHRFGGCTVEQLASRLEEAGLHRIGGQRGGVVRFRRESLM